MPTELTSRSTHQEIRALIWGLVTGLSGRSGDHSALVNGIKLRVGLVALQLISQAYEAKSNRETGEDGIQWAELSPQTIANRRLGAEDVHMLKDLGITKRKHG